MKKYYNTNTAWKEWGRIRNDKDQGLWPVVRALTVLLLIIIFLINI